MAGDGCGGKVKGIWFAFVVVDFCLGRCQLAAWNLITYLLAVNTHFMEQNSCFTSPVRIVGGSYEFPGPSPRSATSLTTKSSPAFYRTPTTKVHW